MLLLLGCLSPTVFVSGPGAFWSLGHVSLPDHGPWDAEPAAFMCSVEDGHLVVVQITDTTVPLSGAGRCVHPVTGEAVPFSVRETTLPLQYPLYQYHWVPW